MANPTAMENIFERMLLTQPFAATNRVGAFFFEC
jgi:hypothetical protein